jgi:ornithine cyclodeaminase
MRIINLHDIKKIMKSVDIISAIEEGFIAYSTGNCVVPPIGELLFKTPPGEVHIKSGYIRGDDYYVIKIASGFYNNQAFNLPSSNGLMMLFSQKTGELLTILLDEGYLTHIRTGAAGAIAAKYLAPSSVNCIGIIGTGTQARLQLSFLRSIIPCRNVMVFGRNYGNL